MSESAAKVSGESVAGFDSPPAGNGGSSEASPAGDAVVEHPTVTSQPGAGVAPGPSSVSSGATPRVSVLTPTIPARAAFLEECKASVEAQTLDGYEHVIMYDRHAEGCSITTNRCANAAKGEWLLPLADDDLLLPGAISTLLGATCDADIVYSPPLVTGNEDRWWFFQAPPVLPSTALVRASLWHELGGYDETLDHEEDRDLWIKALDAGARFVRVDDPCWIYRQHSGNKSFNKKAVPA